MKLAPRLLLLGVALPLVGLLVAVAIAGTLFRRSLEQDVDRRLLSQAAIESVSLFDGPDGRPHSHLPTSSLASEVAAFAPETVLLDPRGEVVIDNRAVGLGPLPSAPANAAQAMLTTQGDHRRTLTVGVERPGEGMYTLHLVASLQPVEATMRQFYGALGLTASLIAIVVTLILQLQVRGLVRRIRTLGTLGAILGRADAPPEHVMEGADELADLGILLQEAARRAHELRLAQERFLANAAHQLRTPLAVLRTEIDLALRRPRVLAELREALEMARTETERLTELARKLLDFESLRAQPVEREEVELAELLRDVARRRATTAKERGIVVETRGQPTRVCCDRLLVSQAVENLLDNALRFAPPESTVQLRAIGSFEHCQLLVHDDGPGIAFEERERIFEPFQRGSSPEAQTGLGLAFVSEVAKKHGGRAFLVPSSRGTTVAIELPS